MENPRFSEILRDLMIERNYSQVELAKLLGIKQSQISEWLSGKNLPGYDSLRLIAVKLDISADVLLGLE